SVFIGVGAVVASFLPWLLTHFGVANTAPAGTVPHSVMYSFYAGAAVLLGAMLWTICTTREYPPEQLEAFADSHVAAEPADVAGAWRPGALFLLLGAALLVLIHHYALRAELYLLAGGLVGAGALFLWLARTRRVGALRQIMGDLYGMPREMRRLNWVQFFSWFAMFAMWINTTPAVGGLAAILIPLLVRACGLRWSHLINLWLGGLGLLSFLFIRDPHWLIVSMIGVGFAWASILSLPYAMLSDNLPAAKMGIYMGIFNFFIVIPQLLAASVLG